MATANPITETPGYVAGTWAIDPIHSDVSFAVRHMMVSKVRGLFSKFEGTIRLGDDFADSSVEASIDMGSIDTHNEQRDGHIRSADFFDAATYPTMSYMPQGGGLRTGDRDSDPGVSVYRRSRVAYTAKRNANSPHVFISVDLRHPGGGDTDVAHC